MHNGANFVYEFDGSDFGTTSTTLYRSNRNEDFYGNILQQNAFAGKVGSFDAFYDIYEGALNTRTSFRKSYNLSGRFASWSKQTNHSLGRPDRTNQAMTSFYYNGADATANYDLLWGGSCHTINSTYENVYILRLSSSDGSIVNQAQTVLDRSNTSWRVGSIACDADGKVYASCYSQSFQDEFYILKLNSDLTLNTCLKFQRGGGADTASRELEQRYPMRLTSDGEFFYVPIWNPYMPFVTPSGNRYSRDFAILKMPTDMSLTGTFSWPATAAGFDPYANANTEATLVIADITSEVTVSAASQTVFDVSSSASFSTFTQTASTRVDALSQNLTYYGSSSNSYTSTDTV